MPRQVLREYQADGLERTRAALRRLRAEKKRQRVVVAAPTGSGKTTIAALGIIEPAVAKGGQVLFIAHRKELIDQCSARLDDHNVSHGVIMADHPRWQPLWPVQVASVQTLVRRLDRVPMRPTIVIVDEAHHARAETYGKVLDAFPDAVVVGLTATPWRGDGRGLGELFDDIVVVSTPAKLVDLWRSDPSQGLVPVTGYAYDAPNLDAVRVKSTGDYDDEELARTMMRSTIVGNVLEQYMQHARGQRAVGFAVTIEHSLAMTAQFLDGGIRTEHLDGFTPKPKREAILARLASGETEVVWNVGVLTEGWDCPAVTTCLLARPTRSVSLFLQIVGRIRRPLPGKLCARLHDHSGAVFAHGHPDADRDYSLTYDPRKAKRLAGDDVVQLRRCQACCATYDSTFEACPECGHANESVRRKAPKLVDGFAVPLEDAAQKDPALIPWETRRKIYDGLLSIAISRNFKRPEGWAAHRYKERFKEFPPRSWEWRRRA